MLIMPGCLLEKPDMELDSEVHQARTWKSHRESLDKKMRFDWDLLPSCSRWLGFIKQHRLIEGEPEDVMFIIPASEGSAALKRPRSKRIYSGLHSFCTSACRAVLAYELICLTVWITSCPLFSRREHWSSTGRRCQSGIRGREGMNN